MLRLVVAVVIGLAVPASAQPCLGLRAVDEVFRISATSSNDRSAPAVAYSSTSDVYAVVWREVLVATGADIIGRIAAGDGTLQTTPIPVVTKNNAQFEADIAWNSTNNQFLVIWRSQESGNDCFGRILTPAGDLGVSDFEIISGANEARVAHGVSGNRYLVTARSGGCAGQRVNANGTLDGTEFAIQTTGQVAPNGDVAYDSINNRFLAVWRDQESTERDIKARLVNPNGSFVDVPFVVGDLFPNEISVAFNPLGSQFLVVCDVQSGPGLRARLVSAAGAPLGGVIEITDEETDAPAVAFHTTQNAYVIVGQRENDIIAYVVEADGTPTADRMVLVEGTLPGAADIAYNPDTAELLAVWGDTVNGVDRIAGRRLDFGGDQNACPSGSCGAGLCGLGLLPFLPLTLLAFLAFRGRRAMRRANRRGHRHRRRHR